MNLTFISMIFIVWFISLIGVYIVGFQDGEDTAEEEFYGVSSTKGDWN